MLYKMNKNNNNNKIENKIIILMNNKQILQTYNKINTIKNKHKNLTKKK